MTISEEFASGIRDAAKSIERKMLYFTAFVLAGLGALLHLGVLTDLWVLVVPALQHFALKVVIGAYYGFNVAPSLIEARGKRQP